MRLGLIGCLIAASALGFASVRSDIERQYKRWAKAALVNDVETILDILTPDYTLTTFSGTVIPMKDYEASLRKRKANNSPATAYKTKMADISVSGDKAIVISDETSETQSLDPITNKPVTLLHTHRYEDTWVKLANKWRLRSTVTKFETTKAVSSK